MRRLLALAAVPVRRRTRASGSTFPLGTTTVGCAAGDSHGMTASGSFTVAVVDTTKPALTLPSATAVDATGPSGAVVAWTANAADLAAFENEVRAQSGKAVPAADAANLLALAERIRAVLGCG